MIHLPMSMYIASTHPLGQMSLFTLGSKALSVKALEIKKNIDTIIFLLPHKLSIVDSESLNSSKYFFLYLLQCLFHATVK